MNAEADLDKFLGTRKTFTARLILGNDYNALVGRETIARATLRSWESKGLIVRTASTKKAVTYRKMR